MLLQQPSCTLLKLCSFSVGFWEELGTSSCRKAVLDVFQNFWLYLSTDMSMFC